MNAVASTAPKKAKPQRAGSQTWGKLAQAVCAHICSTLFDANQTNGAQRNDAFELAERAENLLYFMQVSPTTDLLWTNGDDPSHAITLFSNAQELLQRALDVHAQQGGLADVQVFVIPAVMDTLRRLDAALHDVPANLERLQAFALSPAAVSAGAPPQNPPAKAACVAKTDEAERIRIAGDANYEIGKLAEMLKAHYMKESTEEWRIYHGILGRIEQLSEVVFYAMRLGGTDHGATFPSNKTLRGFLDGQFGLIVEHEA